MRVLFATPYSSASPSGVGSFVRLFVARARADSGVPLVVEPKARAPPGLGNAWLAVRSAREAFRRHREFDVVHAQQLHMQSLAVAIVGRALGKGVVITVHGHQPQPRGLRGALGTLVERTTVRVPHKLVFVADSLRASYGGVGVVIPNGVPASEIASAAEARASAREEIGAGDAFVILYVGRVTEDKGIPTLLEAFRAVRARVPRPLRLLLVGPVEDPVRVAIDRAPGFQSGVGLLGPRSDPLRYMAAADLFVLPSTREGLPLSLLEAMASGLPVVATEVGDVPRVVRPDSTGILVPPRDAAKLAEAIAWVLDHPAEVAAMAARGRSLVEAEFDLTRVWAAYREAYAEAARLAA